MSDTLVSDWSMYQAVYHGDPHNFDQLYDPTYWTVAIDFAQVKTACTGVIIRVGIGTRRDPCFDRYLAGLRAAEIPWGIYHAYDPLVDAVHQAQLVRQWCPETPPLGVWADIEMGTAIAAVTFVYLAALDSEFGGLIGIYSGGPYLDAHFTAAQQDQLDERLLWIAGYPNYYPPYGWDGGKQHALHQYTDAYQLPGLSKACDMSVPGPVWPYGSSPMVTIPIASTITPPAGHAGVNQGCLLLGHTQGNSSITPTYQQIIDRAKAQGKKACIKFGISDEDGGKLIEWQAMGVEAGVNRKHLPETGPNHWMEEGGDADTPLTPQQKQDFIDTARRLPYKAGPTEFRATRWFQVTGNEWRRNTPQGWLDYLDLCQQVVIQGEQMGVHEKAMLMGISDGEAATLPPVRYAFPVFNAGTPPEWSHYEAIAAHPIWPLASRRGDLLFGHEGIDFDQPFDYGENQPVEPGAPQVPGAGLMNFRIFNLLWLLWTRGIRVWWGVGEWYDGRRGRGTDVPGRVANMKRHEGKLAASPFAIDCVGEGQFEFTNDPNSPWCAQDCTLLWGPDWQQYVIDVSDRHNGDTGVTDMKTYSDAQVTAIQSDLAQAQAILATAHTWKVNDVALAIISPLVTYVAPGGLAHDLRPPFPGGPIVTYDLDVAEVSPDGAWLRVATALWVRVVDVKSKS